jgi:hypothetical protein
MIKNYVSGLGSIQRRAFVMRVGLLSIVALVLGAGVFYGRSMASTLASSSEIESTGPLLVAASANPNTITLPSALVNRQTKLSPGPEDSRIANIISHLMEKRHYSQQPFDDLVSSNFFNQYLDALDPLHLILFQSDIQEFEPYRYVLDDLTRKRGDLKPAYAIFDRYLKRFNEQVSFVTNALQNRPFTFTMDEEYLIQRRNAPRPW